MLYELRSSWNCALFEALVESSNRWYNILKSCSEELTFGFACKYRQLNIGKPKLIKWRDVQRGFLA